MAMMVAPESNLWFHSPYDVQVRILWTKQRGLCAICQRPVDCSVRGGRDQRSLDHIRPLSQGGRHNIENVQLVHMVCNSRKGNGMRTRRVASGTNIGIREHNSGYQVFVKVGGRFYSRMFPKTATRLEMQDWRYRQRETARASLPDPVPTMPGPVTFDERQQAAVLTLLREAIREQATGGRPIFEAMRARLSASEGTV
jgi:hypothetical protein